MARGHKIDRISEIPLVVTDDIQSYQKTKQAVEFLKRIKAWDDTYKVKLTRRVRSGKGKMRNRKYKEKKGPLIIYDKNNGIDKAFRNIKGIELMSVNRLNLLDLCPGGHVGRLVIWTEGAFKQLKDIFGSYTNAGDSKIKKRGGSQYQLPRPLLINTDFDKIIQSDEIQNVIRGRIYKKRQIKKKIH